MLHDQPHLRRLILIGTPLLTGILLLFHPRPNAAEMGLPEQHLGTMDVYTLLSPFVDRFLAIHVIFALALALLGLCVILLLDGVRGAAAKISRIGAFVFAVTYIMYETIIGTVTALLVRGAVSLPSDEQTVISAAVNRIWMDPLLGDGPSVLFLVATLSWPLAVISAAVALRRSGLLLPCILLGLSSMFTFHASPLGSAGMLLFLLAVLGIERASSPAANVEYTTTAST
jgi:hypothetical protein